MTTKQRADHYTSEAIEVLMGLDPVKRNPGMYTNTSHPNHLAQEAIDNSVDEAIGGHATNITVILYPDNSLEVTDDGRGMPTDIHPEEKISGVELILTRLHAGAKFSDKHANFIINEGTAQAVDVIALITLMKDKVREIFDVKLELEVKIIGE